MSSSKTTKKPAPEASPVAVADTPAAFPLEHVDEKDLRLAFELLQERSATWSVLKTSSRAHRRVDSHVFTGELLPPAYTSATDPEEYAKETALLRIVAAMMRTAQDSVPGAIIPIQLYMCYYADGSDSCPAHRHECRQLTLSLGAPRVLTVDGKHRLMEHGQAILLHKHKHGVPRQKTSDAPRASLNLFFTVAAEVDLASVNSRRAAKRQKLHDEKAA